jgi:hypothetical protein
MRRISHLLALLMLAVVGCQDRRTAGRELAAGLPDGGHVKISLQYRRGGCIESEKPTDCYYYRVRLEPKGRFDQALSNAEALHQPVPCGVPTRVLIRFYDTQGFSLYRTAELLTSGNYLAPGWNDVPDEVHHENGVWTWQGTLPAESIPLSQFPALVSIRAVYGGVTCDPSRDDA